MNTIIQKAQRGEMSAMTVLYNSNKSKVSYLCQKLLFDEKEADIGTVYVFKKAWEDIIANRIGNEEDFSTFVIRKAVTYCKAITLKKNRRAFNIPVNSNFTSYPCEIEKMDCTSDLCSVILLNLPVLHRFIYVIHTVAGYSNEEIARLIGTKTKMIEMALDVESANIARIIALVEKKMKVDAEMDMEQFHEKLVKKAAVNSVPSSVNVVVRTNIENICTPIQKRIKKKQLRIAGIACAGILVSGSIAGIIFSSGNSDSTVFIGSSATESPDDVEDEELSYNITEESKLSDETANAVIEATYYADIMIEDYGSITVALDGNAAPKTVENFVSLAESGFYDGLTFHRIIDGFMMQGGDPNGDGTGGSENTIIGEFMDNGVENNLSHTRGAVSMARSNDYDSASSQFFIVQEDSTNLDGQYAVFGYVTSGMDIVDAICESAEPTDDNGTIVSEQQPVITSITITEAEGSAEEDA